jgi:hypothetical protein
LKFNANGVACPTELITLLILFGSIVSNILVNIGWNNAVYGQNVQSAFPQFPMIPSSSNTSNTNASSSKKASQELLQPLPSPSSSTTSDANRTSKQSTSQLPSSSSSLSSSSVLHGVRITVPIKGQQVPAGTLLKISGTSKDNATSDCQVSIIANGVKPYQNTSAAGSDGPKDYSRWTFSLSSNYTLIKQGTNEITAKFSCNSNPSLASFYSVNVTGVLSAAQKG